MAEAGLDEVRRLKVVISGAGVAGPTLAYFLSKGGHEVVMLERSGGFRDGGYVVDFWGHGFDVADRMGIIPSLRQQGYDVEELKLVDENDNRVGGMPFTAMREMMRNRFTTIPRGELARTVFELATSQPNVEMRFDCSITEIEEREDAVEVKLSTGDSIVADVLVGADGLHSNVRKLAFDFDEDGLKVGEVDEERGGLKYMGMKVAAVTVEGFEADAAYVSYAEPMRSVSWFSLRDGKALLLFVYVDDNPELPRGQEAKKEELKRAYEGMLGRGPRAIELALASDYLYLDAVAQTRLPTWHRQRVVLVGDAAGCPSLLAGEGTSLGMCEAYILAGELTRCGGNVTQAFEAYQKTLFDYVRGQQKQAEGFAPAFAPRTRLGLTLRNWCSRILGVGWIQKWVLGGMMGDSTKFEDYFDMPLSKEEPPADEGAE